MLLQKKIDKRGRKLIDFDKERHNVQQLASNPNRNEAKFARWDELHFWGKYLIPFCWYFLPKDKLMQVRLVVELVSFDDRSILSL